ncbi:MAG: histidine--tRNA ligase [Bacteroidetes bacterium]|nr:histidine--tRNA ligase [Bacteroidota bacterium]
MPCFVNTDFQSIKGTFDILPDTATTDGASPAPTTTWRYVERVVHRVMARFNAEEIRTPVLEPTPLIARGIGAYTDIVSKEMFAFERGDTQYVLRPEVTAPVMRAYLQHHLDQRGGVQKLYYIGPCFRAERPQKGRYRQFHQFGAEIMGTADPRADAECIAMMQAIYDAVGLTGLTLRLNSVGNPPSRARFVEALQTYLQPYLEELSETSRQRLETNPLRILDTKNEHEQEILQEAPVLLDFLDQESRAHYDTVKGLLDDLDVAYTEDPTLVRGLDYYTHTAFELESDDLGAQSALGGGGRYDLLAQELGSKQPVPSIGFASGIERLLLAMDAQGVAVPAKPTADVFLAALGDEAERWVFRWAQQLRTEGLAVALDLRGRSLKAQMKEANRQDAPYTLIIGGNELNTGRASVKEMATGEQEEVAFDALVDYLKGRLPAVA